MEDLLTMRKGFDGQKINACLSNQLQLVFINPNIGFTRLPGRLAVQGLSQHPCHWLSAEGDFMEGWQHT